MRKILCAVLLVLLACMINPPIQVYAAKCTITYKPNGGDGSTKTKKVEEGKKHEFLANDTFKKTGYKLSKWNTKKDGSGTTYKCEKEYTIKKDITVYAQWKAKTFTVTFNSMGGTAVANKTVTYNSTYGDLATPSRTGYKFAGWFTSSTGGTQITASTKVKITAAQTLYAHWTPNSYTVYFNSQGGTAVNAKTVTYASTYGSMATPARTGYTFLGWYTAASGGTKVVSTTVVSILANQTLYAQWKANTYTVNFNSMGGNAIAAKNVTYDSTYGTLTTPTRLGYTFLGWYTASSGGTRVLNTTVVKITTAQTLYAQWSENSYSIQYNNNASSIQGIDITGSMTAHKQKYTQRVKLTENKFHANGYHVGSWNTKSDGTGSSYEVGAEVSMLGTANNQVVTLYAIWVANEYTFSFEKNGGTGTLIENRTQAYNEVLNLPICTYIRDGYEYIEWNTKPDGTGISMQDAIVGIKWELAQYADENNLIKLYAVWKPMNYYIYFYLNEEDAEMADDLFEREVTFGTAIGELPIPTRPYYDFTGWVLEDGTPVTAETIYNYPRDIDLYDTWKLKVLTIQFDAKGGYFVDPAQATRRINALSTLGTMPQVKRKGYVFKGWVRIKDGKKTKITATTKLGGDMCLEAQWKKVTKPKNIKKLSAKRKSGGKRIDLEIKMPKNAKADGYKIQYSTNKNFKKKYTKTICVSSKKAKLKKLKAKKDYYIRVCAYNKDSEGNLKQSKWKKVKR